VNGKKRTFPHFGHGTKPVCPGIVSPFISGHGRRPRKDGDG
jgi:hypothetical protein